MAIAFRGLLLTALLSPGVSLFGQGIFNNAAKPGDPICSRAEIANDPRFGSGQAAQFGNVLGDNPSGDGMLQGGGSVSAGTTGGNLGAARSLNELYQKGHGFFPKAIRKDVSAFTAYGKDGKPVSVASLKGKIVVVELWSYHCEPSARMLMELAQLYPRRDKFGFEVLAVNYDATRGLDNSDATGGWAAIRSFQVSNREFFDQHPMPFYVPGTGKEGAINFLDQVNSLPLLAVIDRDGKLASLDVGYQAQEVGQRLSQLIKEEQAAKGAAK